MSTKRWAATGPQRLEPCEHLAAVVADVAAELHMRDRPRARVLAHPADRHRQQLGDLLRLQETIAHTAPQRGAIEGDQVTP
jgi:hypothetical protein